MLFAAILLFWIVLSAILSPFTTLLPSIVFVMKPAGMVRPSDGRVKVFQMAMLAAVKAPTVVPDAPALADTVSSQVV